MKAVTSASGYQEPDDDEKGAGGIGNNAIFGGNVGIGTMNPLARLHVFGSPGVDGIMFPDGTLQTTASTNGWSDTFWKKEKLSYIQHKQRQCRDRHKNSEVKVRSKR